MVLKTTFVMRFGVMTVAKFSAVVGAVYGLVYGVIIALLGPSIMGPFMSNLGVAGMAGFGIAVIVLGIIFGVIFGFIVGAIMAVVYNFILGLIGGIQMDLEIRE
jgi:hypothetical protein